MKRCGDCRHWRTLDCPYERNRTQEKYDLFKYDPACGSFDEYKGEAPKTITEIDSLKNQIEALKRRADKHKSSFEEVLQENEELKKYRDENYMPWPKMFDRMKQAEQDRDTNAKHAFEVMNENEELKKKKAQAERDRDTLRTQIAPLLSACYGIVNASPPTTTGGDFCQVNQWAAFNAQICIREFERRMKEVQK